MLSEAHQRWIRTTAGGICCSKPWMLDDAVQEGFVAYWEAYQHRPGDSGYALGAAKLRMKGFVGRGDKPFGGTGHQGSRQAEEFRVPEDRSIEDYESTYIEIEAELAHSRVEIAKVVSTLTHRQQQVVYAVAFDRPMSSSQRGEWSGRLRPRLQKELEHLK